jgi:hypothetical protein
MPEAVRLYHAARSCLGSLGKSKAARLVLSLFFKAALGIQRVFHFETLDDPGFAVLTGGDTVLDRNMLGGLVRAAPVRGVLRFVRKTAPRVKQAVLHTISVDEHAIARFTRKFSIRKGFHTIRNKKMKVEKLFFSFHLQSRQLLSLIVTRGNAHLATITRKLLPSLRRRARGSQLRIILDAGAANNHDELLDLADAPRQVTLVRVPRRTSYRKSWARIPAVRWQRMEEPGRHKNAPPKIIHVTETRMCVKGASKRSRDVRTIVVREEHRRGKNRWHAIWAFGDEDTAAYDLVKEFRTRQHHEQTYRVMLHDAYVDTAPSGYEKRSSNPERPGFKQNALTLYAWVAALATNALLDFTKPLPGRFRYAHPRTLRRWFFQVPTDIFLGNGTLIVLLKPKRLTDTWQALVERANRRALRIPWMDNRRLILSLDAANLPKRSEVRAEPHGANGGVWC